MGLPHGEGWPPAFPSPAPASQPPSCCSCMLISERAHGRFSRVRGSLPASLTVRPRLIGAGTDTLCRLRGGRGRGDSLFCAPAPVAAADPLRGRTCFLLFLVRGSCLLCVVSCAHGSCITLQSACAVMRQRGCTCSGSSLMVVVLTPPVVLTVPHTHGCSNSSSSSSSATAQPLAKVGPSPPRCLAACRDGLPRQAHYCGWMQDGGC